MVSLLFALCNFSLELGRESGVDAAKSAENSREFLRLSIDVQVAEFKERFAIAGPHVGSLFVSSLGGVKFSLFAKVVAEKEEVVRLD